MKFTDDNCAKSYIQTEYGMFDIFVIKHSKSGFGDVTVLKHGDGEIPLVRIHSECLTGDVFHSLMCDCYQQLVQSMKMISKNKYGMLIYLRQEGRGIGLFNKIRTYALQREGVDTLDANIMLGFKPDERDYSVAADVLKGFDISEVKLITNNIDKVKQLEQHGINVLERVPCIIKANQYDEYYLQTKKNRMGHLLE